MRTLFAVALLVIIAVANAQNADRLVDSIFKTKTMCAAIYSPVCDKTGKVYSNNCMAKNAGVTETYPCGLQALKNKKIKINPLSDSEWSYWDCIKSHCKNAYVCTACLALKPSQTSACDGYKAGAGQCCWNDAAARQNRLPRC
jgi:hypothetical protein